MPHIHPYYENKILSEIVELLKWSPGIISPISNFLQILDIYKTGKAYDVDSITFTLFILGNIGGYLFTKQYFSIKALLAYIVPSILDIYIIGIKYNKDNDKNNEIIYTSILSSILFITILSVFIFRNNNTFKRMIDKIANYGGSLTAIVYPVATILQLVKIIKNDSATGVSINTWILNLVVNIGLYFLSNQYSNWRSIIGFLGTGLICAIIIFYIIDLKNKKDDINHSNHSSKTTN